MSTNENKSASYSFQASYKDDLYTQNLGGYSKALGAEVTIFLNRFKIPSAIYEEDDEIKLSIDRFVKINLMNINWYSKKIELEKKIKRRYLFANIALVLLIPYFVFKLTNYTIENTQSGIDDAKYITSVLTVVLTMVFALNKLMNTWYAQRDFISGFHEALIGLKNILYSVEDEWRVEKKNALIKADGSIDPEFLDDLLEQTQKSRQIVDTETKSYFAKISTPHQIDLKSVLTDSRNNATQTITTLKSPQFDIETTQQKTNSLIDKKAEKEKKKKAIIANTQALKEITEIILKKEQEKSLLDPTKNKTEINLIKTNIKALQKEYDTFQLQIIKDRASIS
jgi:hypothetical protein